MVSTKFWNTPSNQLLKRDFVHNEVYTCISDMASFLFADTDEAYAHYEDFENYYYNVCPHCLERIEDFEILLKYSAENPDNDTHCCPSCGEDIESPELMPSEILEYYLVSPWLGAQLRKHGECVYPRFGAWVWGRCTSGQAILLDDVISQICNENDLLTEG